MCMDSAHGSLCRLWLSGGTSGFTADVLVIIYLLCDTDLRASGRTLLTGSNAIPDVLSLKVVYKIQITPYDTSRVMV